MAHDAEIRLTPVIERQMGSLALSELTATGMVAVMRAVTWYNYLCRIGISAPLVVVHDLGCLVAGLARPGSSSQGMGDHMLGESWRQLLVEVSSADLIRCHGAWKHRDAMIAVVLARVLANVASQLPVEWRGHRPAELPVEAGRFARVDPKSAYTRYDQDHAEAWLETMCTHRLMVVLEVEQIDIDALRLFGLFRSGGNDVGGVDLADMYSVIINPALSDVVDFSLELLPSLLEVKRETGQQCFGFDGYASIERVGNLDDLVLSQLAFDDETFEHKYINRELFYYTHEKQIENERRTHLVLLDGSASMRGAREVFARGFALALCKRLALLGERAVLRFFDSRLYEGVEVSADGNAELPHVLQFRAEHGRNYANVARQLSDLVERMRVDGPLVVYLITHGECIFPVDLVERISSIAPIYGLFILPQGELDLPYLHLLHRVEPIDPRAASVDGRALHARRIIQDVESDLDVGDRRSSQGAERRIASASRAGPGRSASGASGSRSGPGPSGHRGVAGIDGPSRSGGGSS